MLIARMLPLRMLGLLMLMFSLCDADSSCPTELNPLTLDTPKIIEKYGESVVVNCSSTFEDHDGMYWRVGNTDSPKQYENSYISSSVPLSAWNLTAECRIMLNDTHQCSKDLEITMYQIPEVTVYPIKHAAAVEGIPYELQCDIMDVAPVQNLVVRWYKDNQTIKMYTFTNTTKTPVCESSTLVVNISRGEDGAQFRCEAQLDFGPDAPQLPADSDAYTVSVHYAPDFKNKTEEVYVYEGHDVTLNCEAEGQPPPVCHWKLDGGRLVTMNNVTIARVNTSETYSCLATNYLGNITKQIHVYVRKMIAPATPAAITTHEPLTPRGCPLVLTPAELVVRFGDPASINCSTSATDHLGMGWEAKNGGLTSKGPAITWTVDKVKDWTTNPLCFINLSKKDLYYQCSVTAKITLYKTPDLVLVFALTQGPMMEGKEYKLRCDIINVTPLQKLKVTWYRDNETVQTQLFNDTSEGPVTAWSILSFTAVRDHNNALYRCKTELQLGPNGPELVPTVTSIPHMVVVLYKPLIKACPGHYAGVEHTFSMDKLSCEADGYPPPIFQWYYEGELINASEPLSRNQSGKYTAEVTNRLGRSNTSVDITIEYGPRFACNQRYEVEGNDKVQCEPKGIPKPTVTWEKEGKEIVSPQRWTKHDSGYYSLKATNTHGTHTHHLYIDVLYAPEFQDGSYNKEVNLGINVTFDCSAEGKPPPEISWNYTSAANVRETTRGQHKLISVTEATSTNGGVYVCVATNKVGKVTRTVTLIMKGKASASLLKFIWWPLIIFVVIAVVIISIFVHKHCKKHGQYSFVPDKANDGSEIPMTPQSKGGQA